MRRGIFGFFRFFSIFLGFSGCNFGLNFIKVVGLHLRISIKRKLPALIWRESRGMTRAYACTGRVFLSVDAVGSLAGG